LQSFTVNKKLKNIIGKEMKNARKKNQKQSDEVNDGANVLIRKYENRRLYSVNHKTYINLEDISSYLSDGKKIKVIEVDTEKDITCEVLLQILLAQGKADLIPQEVLEIMVRMNDSLLKKFWTPYEKFLSHWFLK
jgi:polyhydroxyalkanoate synthesis repressor PhaR